LGAGPRGFPFDIIPGLEFFNHGVTLLKVDVDAGSSKKQARLFGFDTAARVGWPLGFKAINGPDAKAEFLYLFQLRRWKADRNESQNIISITGVPD
jgi:hypothetical protein